MCTSKKEFSTRYLNEKKDTSKGDIKLILNDYGLHSDSFGINLESIWNQFGINLESIRTFRIFRNEGPLFPKQIICISLFLEAWYSCVALDDINGFDN